MDLGPARRERFQNPEQASLEVEAAFAVAAGVEEPGLKQMDWQLYRLAMAKGAGKPELHELLETVVERLLVEQEPMRREEMILKL